MPGLGDDLVGGQSGVVGDVEEVAKLVEQHPLAGDFEVLAQCDDPVVPLAVAGLVGELGDVLADGGDVLVSPLGHDRLLVSCGPGPALACRVR